MHVHGFMGRLRTDPTQRAAPNLTRDAFAFFFITPPSPAIRPRLGFTTTVPLMSRRWPVCGDDCILDWEAVCGDDNGMPSFNRQAPMEMAARLEARADETQRRAVGCGPQLARASRCEGRGSKPGQLQQRASAF